MRARAGGRPAMARMTGARNSWNVKIAEVGKPGSTATGTPSCTARHSGLPGFNATPCTSTPGRTRPATTPAATSPAPLDVPPDSSTMSDASARSSIARSAAGSSGTMPSGTGTPPNSSTAAARIAALLS